MTNKTQVQTLLHHFKQTSTITVREAVVEYSISSLTRRIRDLRELGHKIVSTHKTHPVTGQRYVRYVYINQVKGA